MKNQKGFTLIELLVVVAIIGILAQLAATSFSVYRSKAAYSNCQKTMHDVQTAANAGTINPDNPPSAVALTTQNVPGPITDAAARNYLVGMQMPRNMKLQVSYDPSCVDASCVNSFAQLNHCAAKQYIQWVHYGDGTDLLLENIAGAGC